MPVEVQLGASQGPLPHAGEVARWAEATLDELGEEPEPPDLCIRLVDEGESRTLNQRYRGIDKPTNVLSFAADVSVPGARLLGDLVICAPVVHAEAQAQGKAVDDHFAHMVVHGVLHLCGFDHEGEADAQQMENLERKILHGLGIGDPY